MLTETHLAILRAAADRADALLSPPDHLRGATRSRMAARLLALGLAEHAPVAVDGPRWLSAEDGAGVGLRLTAAGRDASAAAIAQDRDPAGCEAMSESDWNCRPDPRRDGSRPPRPGSKAALLLGLVGRDGGATLDRLADALGWQRHTIRAALTRLRQGGAQVERVSGEDGCSLYRLAVAPPRSDGAAMDVSGGQDGAA